MKILGKMIDVISGTLQLNNVFYLQGFKSLFSISDYRWIHSLKLKMFFEKV